MFSAWNNNYVEPIRDIFYSTPSQKICELEHIHHFVMINHPDSEMKNGQIHSLGDVEKNIISPVIVNYVFINRHYILDLLPEIGVVRNLLFQGLVICIALNDVLTESRDIDLFEFKSGHVV